MNERSPAEVQASLLTEMNAQDAASRGYLNTFPVGAPSSAMASWIGGLGRVEWDYQKLRLICTWLEQNGFPQALQRLDATLGRLAETRNIYIGMYNDRVRAENTQAGIWQNAIQFGTNQAMAANTYQNAAAQTWVQGMFDVNEKRCYDCHKTIGITGGGYCYDCARRRGWVY